MAKERKAYVRLPTWILNTAEIATLPDKDWRKYVTDYAHDPKNIKYEDYRASWLRVRKKMTKKVMKRDGNKCRYCESTDNLQIDHIHPMVRGGTNDIDNLQVLCRTCNLRKSAKVGYDE